MDVSAAENHRQWFAYLAGLSGGTLMQDPLVTWTTAAADTSGGKKTRITVAFPEYSADEADNGIDEVIRRCLALGQPAEIGWWSLAPTAPPDLDVRLLARGFEQGWQPCWMGLDLAGLGEPPRLAEGVSIREVPPGTPPPEGDLPYYDREAAAVFAWAHQRSSLPFCHIGAWCDGRLVGHVVAFFPREHREVAGIYSCGVAPDRRSRGIGSRLTWEACSTAAARGAKAVVLNATPMGEPVYRKLGFAGFGHGRTWWMHESAIRQAPVPARIVRAAEAVGRGDTAALEQAATRLRAGEAAAALPNGLTLLDLAYVFRRRQTARRLLDYGATPDIPVLWGFGWIQKAGAALARDPSLVDRRRPPHGATPLHQAAFDDDLAFARFLISHGADIGARDTSFQATPLQWAKHNNSAEVAAYLESKAAAGP